MLNDKIGYYRTEHELARIKRMFNDRGHYKNCRHYRTSDVFLFCEKFQKIKKSCDGCMICPNCGGLMYTYRLKKESMRNSIYITHSKSCVICGAYIEENFIVNTTEKKKNSINKKNQCQVEGCNHTAYEGYESTLLGYAVSFKICLIHKRRILTWRQHVKKSQSNIPLIIMFGKIYDNPDYKIKQEKRCKTHQ